MKTLAYAVSLALAQLAAGSAYADTAVGVDTALGNTLNPPGRSNIPKPIQADEDIMGTLRHSPTGQLYGVPLKDEEQTQTESGWAYNAEVEAGYLGSGADSKNALFRTYKDPQKGFLLNYFSVSANKPDEARFVDAFGGGVGQRDQFYGALFGRYNDWKTRVFYNETVHVFTNTWRSIYDGEGTGDLRLKGAPGLGAPTMVTAGNPTFGTGACTVAAPCWQYTDMHGTTLIYSNAAATSPTAAQATPTRPVGSNAISGIAGTYANSGAAGSLIAGSGQSNQSEAIAAELAKTPDNELSLIRKKFGLRYDKTLNNDWKSYASYTLEKREGKRPFGYVYANAISLDIAEPIDYDTHEFLAGLAFAREKNQVNLRASYSKFNNNIEELNVEQPLWSGGANSASVLKHSTIVLPPDNDAFNLRAEYGHDFDWLNSRLTAALSWGVNRQDADLIAPYSKVQSADFAAAGVTTLGGTATNPGYANGTTLISNWNTTDALSQKTANQEIENSLANLGFTFKPVDKLRVKTEARYFATDNNGGYMAYNPLTGQFGRGPVDANNLGNMDVVVGSGTAANGGAPTAGSPCYVPPGYPAPTTPGCQFGRGNVVANGANIPVYGQPRSTRQTNYTLGVDYDLTRTQSVNASYEQENFHRSFRERADTWEDKYKVGYVNRDLWDATLRISAEQDSKRGSEYRYRTFEDLGTGLPGLDVNYIIQQANANNPIYNNPTTLAANLFNRYSYYFRKYDQADRDQQIFNGRLIVAPRDDMDMGFTVQWKDVEYPDSYYGLEKDRLNSATVDVNWEPSPETSLWTYYSHQAGEKQNKMNSGQAAGVIANICNLANINAYGLWYCSDGNGTATEPGTQGARPLSSAWQSLAKDENNMFGVGFQHSFGRYSLGVDYNYTTSRTKITNHYESKAINGANAALQAAADAVNNTNSLDDITYDTHTITVNMVMQFTKKLALRVFDRYEEAVVRDWHYDNVISGAVTNMESGQLLLDSGASDYHVNEVGAMLQYKF